MELSLLCRCFCSCFLSSLCGSSLFSSFSSSLFSLSLLLCESLSSSLVNLYLSSLSSLCLVSGSLVKTKFLSLDLSVSLSFPVSEFLVSLLLCKSALSYTACEMLLEENTFIRENTTGYECWFCTNVKPEPICSM